VRCSNALGANKRTSDVTIKKWGGLASFLLAVAFFLPEWIYLTGNLQEANGPLTYALADLLYGPVKAACLILVVYTLRERIGAQAPRQTSLALLVTALSALMFVTAALLRSSNRQYHLLHPELNLESSQTVLIIWTTLVGGVIATAWHFLGWTLVLLGSAGWMDSRFPRVLSMLYVVGGVAALFVYLLPEFEGFVAVVGVVVSIWQGILLLNAEPGTTPAPKSNTRQPDPG
jgi:hypothetical protein